MFRLSCCCCCTNVGYDQMKPKPTMRHSVRCLRFCFMLPQMLCAHFSVASGSVVNASCSLRLFVVPFWGTGRGSRRWRRKHNDVRVPVLMELPWRRVFCTPSIFIGNLGVTSPFFRCVPRFRVDWSKPLTTVQEVSFGKKPKLSGWRSGLKATVSARGLQ
jgi:hypothetical protein